MDTNVPDVSIVIPTYNRVYFLQKAIASCFAGNDDITVEVIVVDDGSTDDTRSFLKENNDDRVRPIFQDHQGAQVARNTGKEEATGQYIKFLDDDDWLAPGTLAKKATHLDETGADACYGRLRVYSENENSYRGIVKEHPSEDIVITVFKEHMWTVPHKYLFRTGAIEAIDWDLSLPYHQDYGFLIDTACRGLAFVGINDVVGISRQHDGPRIDSRKTGTRRSDYYALKVDLIKRGLSLLEEKGLIRPSYRQAAAEGIWNWAHIVAGHDLETFRQFYHDIEAVTANFNPERNRSWLAALDCMVGPKATEHLLYPMRRIKQILQ